MKIKNQKLNIKIVEFADLINPVKVPAMGIKMLTGLTDWVFAFVGVTAVLCFAATDPNKNVNLTLTDANQGVQKKYVDIGDAYFYYEIAGKGTPVILINFEPNEPLFFKLAENHLTVCYDMRGCGKTDKPVAGEKFTHAEDLNKLMWFLGIQKAHLIGRGIGASIGTEFEKLYPKQIISLSNVDANDSNSIVDFVDK